MKTVLILLTGLIGLLAIGSGAWAITYNVDRSIGAGTVTGFIETDGTIGALSQENIVDWEFTLTATGLDGGSPDMISMAAGFSQLSSGLSASATSLMYDFDAAGYTFFQRAVSPANGWCLAGPGGCGSAGITNGETIFWAPGEQDPVETVARSGIVTVGTTPVPLPGAFPLLAVVLGALALLGCRRR